MEAEELKLLRSLPLDIKIAKTKQRIREWVKHYGEDGVYISFSGGKDSTVLLDIARSIYPDIKAVFCDTGLEYPEIKEFVKKQENIEIIRPTKNFKQILTDCGYPITNKEQAQYIYEIRNSKSEKIINRRLYGDDKGRFKLSKKWHCLIDAPFETSHRCCVYMKKNPFKKYEKETGRVPIIGTLATESILRKQQYLKYGCNAFELKRPRSTPLGFWNESEILEYIVKNDLEIASIYGEIKQDENGSYFMEGINRTGCIFCGFGAQTERPNRYQNLKETHPKLYEYCIKGGNYDQDGLWKPDNEGLGFYKVLEYINVDYK